MVFLDLFRVKTLRRENDLLKSIYSEMETKQYSSVLDLIKKKNAELTGILKLIDEKLKYISDLDQEVENRKSQILVLDEDLLLESFALYKPKFKFSNSEIYRDELDKIRIEQKHLIKNGGAVIGGENWTVNNSKREGKKLVGDVKKLLLRSFNNECDYCVDNVKFNNIEAFINRIRKSFDSCNKLGVVMGVEITESYGDSKLKELILSHEYSTKKQEEKEEQKRIREELREQAKLEQELKEARERIEKDRKHNNLAIKALESRIKNEKNDDIKNELIAKRTEFELNLQELLKEESVVDYREKNAKFGHVYIISNIGAFGKDVYKIGMTRRLFPNERIDELGDASVPFWFDVHAMIPSEDAPALEAKLHTHFSDRRLNKVNRRKEFFRVTIQEIESVIKSSYDKTVEVVLEPEAEQFRETLKINKSVQNSPSSKET